MSHPADDPATEPPTAGTAAVPAFALRAEALGVDPRTRCGWAWQNREMVRYHDEDWGVPVRDDERLFEFLILETSQAGLSWRTILDKREAYRAAFAGFDAERVARFTERDMTRLLADAGIVRNRAKLTASVANARLTLALREEFGSFASYLWGFVDGVAQQGAWPTDADVPVTTPTAEALSKDLRRRGAGFVGPTTAYALMQSVGLVNDHLTTCFRRAEVARAGGEGRAVSASGAAHRSRAAPTAG